MKASNTQILLVGLGVLMLFIFPLGLLALAAIAAIGYLAKHLNPFYRGAEPDPFDEDNPASPTQQTFHHLKAYLAASSPAVINNGESQKLSDREESTWAAIVQDLSENPEQADKD